MKRNRRKWLWMYSHKAGSHTLWYRGKHRWTTRPFNGRVFYYNKATKSFHSYAPKNGGGLKGLKAFWKKRMKKKTYYQKGKFDLLSYLRANGR